MGEPAYRPLRPLRIAETDDDLEPAELRIADADDPEESSKPEPEPLESPPSPESIETGSETVSYWEAARSPGNSILFLTPILVMYEVGVLSLAPSGSEAFRSGADYWLRSWLIGAGVGPLLLPILVLGGLWIWQWRSKRPWVVSRDLFQGMLGECLIFAVVLLAIGRCEDRLFRIAALSVPGGQVSGAEVDLSTGATRNAIAYLGAGIYEEFLFRLCLLPLLFVICRRFLSVRLSAIVAVIASSFIFASAHYLGPAGEPFLWFTFTFRLTAGIAFAALFVLRGFGISVGTHALYDLLVGVILVS